MEPNPKAFKEKKDLLCREIGLRIKEIRRSKNMQQQDLAASCNFEKSNMARIESGRVNVTIGTLLKIALALDVPVLNLIPDKKI